MKRTKPLPSRPMLACLLALGGCQPADDPTFGRSYDSCILKNASRSGDQDSRATATEICARHFLRAATPEEARAASGPASIRFGDHSIPSSDQTSSNLNDTLRLYDREAKRIDTIEALVQNKNDNAIIKSVKIDAYFHKGLPDRFSAKWKSDDPEQHLHWNVDTSIAPGSEDTVSGSFEGGQAPSRFYRASASAVLVVSESDKPPAHLQETNR